MNVKKILGRLVRDLGVIGALAALWYFFNDGVSHWRLERKIDQEAATINAKVDVVDEKVDEVDGKVDAVYYRIDEMDRKLDRIEGKLDRILDIATRPPIDTLP